MTTTLWKDAIGETHTDVERLIYRTIHNHIREHGGNFDDLLSVANEAFMDAYRTHSRSRGAFTTWVVWKVKYALLSDARREAKHRARQVTGIDIEDWFLPAPRFNRRAFLNGLSPDARLTVVLALRPTLDVELAQRLRGDDPGDLKAAIKQVLSSLGWSRTRINRAFREVKNRLRRWTHLDNFGRTDDMAKGKSRVKRWAEAASNAAEALQELESMREEFQEWRDNLPENLDSSPLAEKLDAVCDLDIDGALSTAQEAEAADLPLGFGRD